MVALLSDMLLLLLLVMVRVQLPQVKARVLPQSPLLLPSWQRVRLVGHLTLLLGLECAVRVLLLDAVVLHGASTLSGGHGVSCHQCRTVTLNIQLDTR